MAVVDPINVDAIQRRLWMAVGTVAAMSDVTQGATTERAGTQPTVTEPTNEQTVTERTVTVERVRADVDRISRLLPGPPAEAGHVDIVVGDHPAAPSAFDVDRLLASTAAWSVATADAFGAEAGVPVPARTIDLDHLLAFCTTHVEVDAEPVPAWADISGVYPTLDGRHLQVHCNFPHHAAGVVHRLGCDATPESVAAAIVEHDAFELEAALIDDGMIAAVVRTIAEWDAHPHAAATRDLPLVAAERIGDAAPLLSPPVGTAMGDDPLAGLRVLDCSRVLAGPVGGQMLAGFGADVLRVGAAHLPSVDACVLSTGFGKRNTFVDLRTAEGAAVMTDLLAGADVWIDAYRPGAMAGHGFPPERVAEIRPGIVIVQLSAFDWDGPWAGRRGFDSIVQSTTGIRWAGGDVAVGATGPLGLPVQALDYATGFLGAGLAAHLASHQRRVGGSWLARASLLRTRDHLVALGGPSAFEPTSVTADDRFVDTVDSDAGRITAVRPFAGRWRSAPTALGSSGPGWTSRPVARCDR